MSFCLCCFESVSSNRRFCSSCLRKVGKTNALLGVILPRELFQWLFDECKGDVSDYIQKVLLEKVKQKMQVDSNAGVMIGGEDAGENESL
jgi:hypothetical protein